MPVLPPGFWCPFDEVIALVALVARGVRPSKVAGGQRLRLSPSVHREAPPAIPFNIESARHTKEAIVYAISTMSSSVQGIFFLIAVALFMAAGLSIFPGKKNLMAFGLAFFVFVFMWNAFAAA